MVTSKCTSTGRRCVVSHAYFAMKSGTCHGLNSAVSICGKREAGSEWRERRDERRDVLSVDHRKMNLVRTRGLDCFFVARVGVARDTGSRIIGENALETHAHFRRAVGDDHLTGME